MRRNSSHHFSLLNNKHLFPIASKTACQPTTSCERSFRNCVGAMNLLRYLRQRCFSLSLDVCETAIGPARSSILSRCKQIFNQHVSDNQNIYLVRISRSGAHQVVKKCATKLSNIQISIKLDQICPFLPNISQLFAIIQVLNITDLHFDPIVCNKIGTRADSAPHLFELWSSSSSGEGYNTRL